MKQQFKFNISKSLPEVKNRKIEGCLGTVSKGKCSSLNLAWSLEEGQLYNSASEPKLSTSWALVAHTVILAPRKAETVKFMLRGQPGQKFIRIPSQQ
jgi:hypothetical protein